MNSVRNAETELRIATYFGDEKQNTVSSIVRPLRFCTFKNYQHKIGNMTKYRFIISTNVFK